MDVIVVIPSRGRPGQAAALVDVVRDTVETAVFCAVAVDADDPTLGEYESAMRGRGNAAVAVIDESAGHVGAINGGMKAAQAWTGGTPRAWAKLDDDHLPRTYGWDKILLGELDKMGGGIAYGDDLLQGERLPTAPVISASIVDALGWMALPSLRHMYCDDVWRELGKAAECLRYVPRVHIEHRHFLNGKALVDETYALSSTEERYAADGAVYQAWLAGQCADDAAKIRAVLPAGASPC